MPNKEEMPSTVARSPEKAQRTWVETHDNAVQEYGEGERAHRTAFASLKHSYEKVGDHWETKHDKGPSDERSQQPTESARQNKGTVHGGVDVRGNSKDELMERAKQMGINGRSKMNKEELADALDRENQRQTSRARKNS